MTDGSCHFESALSAGLDRRQKHFLVPPVLLCLALLSCAPRLPSGGVPMRVARMNNESRIETIPLEKYVVGVLEKEVVSSWPLEALKAQAVATRTYAVYRKEHPRSVDYDVADDTSDQVFEARKHHSPALIRAVLETEGETLDYDGQTLPAFFHSCCGGSGEKADQVWPTMSLAPLNHPHEDPYCSACPRSQWDYSLSREEMAALCLEKGVELKKSWKIEVSKRNDSGRVLEVTFPSKGKKQSLSGTAFRELVGYENLKSTLFEISSDADPIVFTGRGSGHGVGLCQWGAKGMADEGKAYQEILEFYYPGSRIAGPRVGSSSDDGELPSLNTVIEKSQTRPESGLE